MQQSGIRLVVRRGPQPNQDYAIAKDVTTLGRDITNDIVINDRETSRHHLRLLRSGESLSVEDLGSTNGTFVNGKRVSGVTALQNGDMIGLGETVTLGVELQAHQPISSPAPGPELPTSEPPIMPTGETPMGEAAYSPAQPAYGYPPADPMAPAAPAQSPQMSAPTYYGQPPSAYQIPPAPQQYAGYEYDPYAAREEGGGGSQWLVLGCFIFFVLAFVCFGFIALLIVDALNMWCDLPVLTQVMAALGFC